MSLTRLMQGTRRLAITVILATACRGEAITAVPTDGIASSPSQLLTATIDGTPWSSARVLFADYSNSFMSLLATDGNTTLQLNFCVTAPGTATLPSVLLSDHTGARWLSVFPPTDASVTVTVFTTTHLAGTFTAVLAPVVSSTTRTTVRVTDGRFGLTYRDLSGGPALPVCSTL